jgi:hypothetical protein
VPQSTWGVSCSFCGSLACISCVNWPVLVLVAAHLKFLDFL